MFSFGSVNTTANENRTMTINFKQKDWKRKTVTIYCTVYTMKTITYKGARALCFKKYSFSYLHCNAIRWLFHSFTGRKTSNWIYIKSLFNCILISLLSISCIFHHNKDKLLEKNKGKIWFVDMSRFKTVPSNKESTFERVASVQLLLFHYLYSEKALKIWSMLVQPKEDFKLMIKP